MTTGPITVSQYYILSGSTLAAKNEEMFNRISGFFNSNPGFQQIAQSGSAGLEESFKVWRAVSSSQPFDVVLKWSYSSFWSFWEIYGDSGSGLTIGMHPTGQAWQGTTTNVQDVPPFSPFKSGSFVFGRPNSTGGAYSNTKNWFERFELTADPTGILISGDYDSFTIAFNILNDSSFNNIMHFEKFISNNPSYNCPYVFLHNKNSTTLFPRDNSFGTVNGDSNYEGSVIYHTASTNITSSLPIGEKFEIDYLTHYSAPMAISTSNFQKVLEFPLMIIAQETGGACVGYINNTRITHNQIANLSRLTSGNRLVLSNSVADASFNITVPWNSGTVINSGSFFSGSVTQFMTGSGVFGYGSGLGIYVDRLGTDSIVTVLSQTIIQENILYRGVIGGQYVYSENERPTGATDVVTIRKI